MANRFSLTRKADINAGPVPLQQIDNEMCEHFGIIPDPGKYYHQWVDTIGLALAGAQSFDEIIKDCNEAIEEQSKIANPEGINYWITKLKVAEYLNSNYVSDTWAEIGTR